MRIDPLVSYFESHIFSRLNQQNSTFAIDQTGIPKTICIWSIFTHSSPHLVRHVPIVMNDHPPKFSSSSDNIFFWIHKYSVNHGISINYVDSWKQLDTPVNQGCSATQSYNIWTTRKGIRGSNLHLTLKTSA